MKYNSFIELEKDIDKFTNAKKYKEALTLLDKEAAVIEHPSEA